jgi:catechol 2,3-dioxygenase-like lactoylglutathione lyase family enzyme
MSDNDSSFEPRVSLITLGVADLARARAFYETGLGWKVSPASQGDVVFFQAGALAIALFPRHLLAEDAGVPAEGAGFSGITIAHNVREPADVDRLLAVAEAAGARITKPAQDAFWGGRTVYFADPDGHLWEVAWNPHFTIKEDGALRLP